MFDIKLTRSKKAIIIAVVLAALVLSGCIGPRGWPGIVADGDALFAGTMDGRVLALNPDSGSRLWEWKPKKDDKAGGFLACGGGGQFRAGMFYGPPVVANGVVYMGAYDGKVYAIDTASGFEEWNYDAGSSIVGGVAVADGTLFVGTSGGELHAIDINTGQSKQGFLPFQTGDKIWSTPVVRDGTVYFGSLDQKLYAIDAETGALKWNEPFEAGGGIASSPLIVGSMVYFGAFDNKFYAVDADTGGEKWVFEEAGNWFWAEALYDNGIIYAGSLDRNVYAIDAGSGALAWSNPFDAGSQIKSSPVISGDVLVVAAEEGKVYGLDLESGEERWDFDLETKVLASLFVSGGKVYVNAQDNRLYTFDGATGQQDWSVTLSE